MQCYKAICNSRTGSFSEGLIVEKCLQNLNGEIDFSQENF